ncbi:hypothetical protein [Paraburkholderia terricola]|uniref:hypothetical protein n=1 Tax=Paraburkholderia terricola TaxID=169427 RepID=UPI001FCA0665|nr:hypothetical protein [Paraburkholderia terricola]
MNMNGNGKHGPMGEVMSRARGDSSKRALNELDINALRSGLEAFTPPKRYTAIEIVRVLFPLLETKRKEGASPEQLAEVLGENNWEVSVQTLKTLMSKVRKERSDQRT